MKMQTVRNILMPQDQASAPSTVSSPTLLPPLASFGPLLSAPRPQPAPKVQDLAERRAGEAYMAARASLEFRARLSQG